MDTKHDIPHREIGEQDDELLEQLWKQLPDSQEDPLEKTSYKTQVSYIDSR